MNNGVDVAVLGSGFGGSMLATLLASHGRQVLLVDRQVHPRFSIGESSTPLADELLRWLGHHYDQPSWAELSCYGSWKQHHPELECGLKRGFTYFHHDASAESKNVEIHERSLLVAASRSDHVGDTHWYRPSVDHYFFQQAQDLGVQSRLGWEVIRIAPGSPNRIWVRSLAEPSERPSIWNADTLIDATGSGAVTAKALRLPDGSSRMNTRTRCVFAHLRKLTKWTDHLTQNEGYDPSVDPYQAESAAVHHVSRDGWVWNLHFDHGVSSVGYSTTNFKGDLQWEDLLSRFPELNPCMDGAETVFGPVTGERTQRLYHPIVADRCWMLPSTAVTIDPLHSTGIAMQLAGVARIAATLLGQMDQATVSKSIRRYQCDLYRETQLLDDLVSTAYHVMPDFERFCIACMLFFLVAIRCEERIQKVGFENQGALFEAGDSNMVDLVHRSCRLLRSPAPTPWVNQTIRGWIEPYNSAGLCRDECRNRYAYTATKR